MFPTGIFSYSCTETRNTKLLHFPTKKKEHTDRNIALFNRKSETALTLWTLGNIDRWTQVTDLALQPRSDKANSNRSPLTPQFFNNIRDFKSNYRTAKQGAAVWGQLHDYESKALFNPGTDFRDITLLIQFEITSTAFHTVDGKAFRLLSFLCLENGLGRWLRKWAAFDAVLILPWEIKVHFYRGQAYKRCVT